MDVSRLFRAGANLLRVSGYAVALLFAFSPSAQAQSVLGPKDGSGLPAADTGRVTAGTLAPVFTLETKDGTTVTLSQYRGKKNVVLVFYRGHWCPFCTEQLVKLQGLLDDKQRDDVELLALAIDTRAQLQTMADKVAAGGGRVAMTFISDPGHKVIDRYGLLNTSRSDGIPHPTTYVIDRSGTVRWKFTEVNYRIRPTNEMILAAVQRLPRQ